MLLCGREKLVATWCLIAANSRLGAVDRALSNNRQALDPIAISAVVLDRVWRETGNYYTLEYLPEERRRELHAIEVKPLNPAWRVRARRSR
jgi:hypothetical protein